MDNTKTPQVTRDSDDAGTGTSGVSNAIIAGTTVVLLFFVVIFVVVVFIYHRRRASFTGATNTGTPSKNDGLEDTELGYSKHMNTECADDLNDTERGVDPTPTASLQTASSEEPAATNRRSRILDPEKTIEKAEFFFPGYLKDTSLTLLKGKYMDRRWGRVTDANVAIQLELEEKLYEQIRNLENSMGDKTKMEKWERLNRRENAADFCKAVGMNPEVVDLRFQLIQNLQKELPFPIHKSHIVVSIQHFIDNIHVVNPFGEDSEIDGKIHRYCRNKEWLSYLGVHFGKNKSEIRSTVGEVQNRISAASSRNGFFAHGTTGPVLEKVLDEDGLRPSEHRKGSYQDFGPGIYTFKDEISCALSFAIDRCWPVLFDQKTNKPSITSRNPAIIVFPDIDHPILNVRQKTLEIRGKAMNEKAMKQMKKTMREEKYKKFVENRKQWKNDKKLGFWKDFTWLSLTTGQMPPKAYSEGYLLFYGPMEKGTFKPGDKEPTVNSDRWIQYCFRDEDALGSEQIFVEFNMDWKEWYEPREDATESEVKDNFVKVQKDIEKTVLGI